MFPLKQQRLQFWLKIAYAGFIYFNSPFQSTAFLLFGNAEAILLRFSCDLVSALHSDQWRSFNGMKGMSHSPKFEGEMWLLIL